MVEIVFTVGKIITILSFLFLAVVVNYYYTAKIAFEGYVENNYSRHVLQDKISWLKTQHTFGYIMIVLYHFVLFKLLAN